jgi:uridine phosphorylase
VPPGTVVVPSASVAITRNVDFDFVNPENSNELAYRISKLVSYDLQFLPNYVVRSERSRPKVSADAALNEEVKFATLQKFSSIICNLGPHCSRGCQTIELDIDHYYGGY